ncbi:MAG: hypothetical protein ABUT20_23075 [Bacteroidota bacterium]
MLKIGELKSGDIINVNYEGAESEGRVVSISHEEHQALVDNGVQEFWYSQEDMKPVPLDEAQLMQLGFVKEESNGMAKYKKDSFRLVLPHNGDFSHIEMWWREDRRHFNFPIGVHQLQNLHLDMTKIPLDKP